MSIRTSAIMLYVSDRVEELTRFTAVKYLEKPVLRVKSSASHLVTCSGSCLLKLRKWKPVFLVANSMQWKYKV